MERKDFIEYAKKALKEKDPIKAKEMRKKADEMYEQLEREGKV